MNYDKLSRSLRYYYEKGIMQKVKKKSNLLLSRESDQEPFLRLKPEQAPFLKEQFI